MKRFFLVLIMLMGICFGVSSLAAQDGADEPVAVGLLNFTAAVQGDGVRLDWETATELNTAGFNIERSSEGSSFEALNDIGFVISQGGVATGATYSELDTTAVIGQTYSYKLVEVETDSSEHDLETVTVLFDPQPTATSIVIGNPTARPSNTPAAIATATKLPTATATGTAVATQNAGQPTTIPLATATPQPAATATSSNSNTTKPQPTNTLPAPPVPTAIPDQAFDESGVNSGVVLAQEEPTSTAYPGPDSPISDTPPDADSYPPGQESPAEIAPENATPYPIGANGDAVPTLAIIGSADPYPPEADITTPSPSSETIRGRILLWAGFLLALFIFLSGVMGAIVLYRRRPA